MPPNCGEDGIDELGRRFGVLSTTSETARVDIPVPLNKVGLVIGREGETIQSLQKQARNDKCSISFDTPQGCPGILVIKGPSLVALAFLEAEVKKLAGLDAGNERKDAFSGFSSAASDAGSSTASAAGTNVRSEANRQPRAIKENYGIIPCTMIGGKFHVLAQVIPRKFPTPTPLPSLR